MAEEFTSAAFESAISKCLADIDAKSHTLVDELADEAVSMANSNFQNAFYAGVNDVSVHSEDDTSVSGEYGKAVVAEGASLLFIEFGTGIMKTDSPYERAQLYGGGAGIVGHGEYGKRRGRQLNGWVYRGEPGLNPPWDTDYVFLRGQTFVHTKGNHANSSLWRARQEIARKMRQKAREVFNR